MRDPFPAGPPDAAPSPPRLVTRRRMLAGAVVLASAAIGAGIGSRTAVRARQPLLRPPRPPRLQAALDRERELISALAVS